MRNPLHLNETDMKCIEAFITFMYTNQRDECDINQARKILFCQRGRAIENIPPTKAALVALSTPTGAHIKEQYVGVSALLPTNNCHVLVIGDG